MYKVIIPIALCFIGNWSEAQKLPGTNDAIWENRVELGYDCMKQGYYQEVLDSSNHWLATAFIPPKHQASLFTLKGNALRRLGDIAGAIALHGDALQIREKCFGPNAEEVAKSSQNLANCYWDIGDFEKAAAFFQKNRSIREQLYAPGDAQLVLPTINLADALFELGRVTEAEPLYQKALAIQIKSAGYIDPTTAVLQTHLANCFFIAGQYHLALDTLTAAWNSFQRLPQSPTLEKGRCLLRMGDCLQETNDLEAALQYYRNAFSFCQADPLLKVELLLSLGRLHRFRGEQDIAIEYLEEVVNIGKENGLSHPTLFRLYQNGLIQLGNSYLDQNEFNGAEYYFETVVAETSKVGIQGELLTSAQLKLGRCYLLQKNHASAGAMFQKALKWAKAHHDPAKEFASHYYLAEVAFSQKDLLGASQLYSLALQSLGAGNAFPYETIQAKAALSTVYKQLAMLSGNVAQWAMAKRFSLEGIAGLDALKGRFKDTQSEIDIQESFFQLYNIAIAATLSLQEPGAAEQAFSLTEQYRGNLFQKFARQAAEFSGNHGALDKEKQLQGILAEAKQRRAALPGSPTFPLQLEEAARLDSLILASQQRLSELQQAQERHLPQYSPAQPSDIRKTLGPEQTLVEYHWGDDQLFAFVLSRDTFLVKALPLPENLETDVLQFFFLCNQNPNWLPQDRQSEFPRLSHQLYAWLLAPLKPWLKEELVIVPDAWLHYLPFDALLTVPPTPSQLYWEYRYLIQSYNSIGYANSASMYKALRQTKSVARLPLAAIAPSFEGDARQLKPLLHNTREAGQAKKVFGGKIFLGKMATKPAFMLSMEGSQVLLFSTHAVLDDKNPASSYLAFTEMPDTINNESLYAWEVYQHSLSADLVVLSACQTANGRLYRGEGLMSLARAFQFAGAKTVVASLWNVDDKQTPELMRQFFENLVEGMPKAKALTMAKRNYLKTAQRLMTHPFFWSGFVSIGDDAPMETNGNGKWWAIGLSMLGLLLIATFLFYRYSMPKDVVNSKLWPRLR